MLLFSFIRSCATIAEPRLLNASRRDTLSLGGPSGLPRVNNTVEPYDPAAISAHLKRRAADTEGNKERRETEVGNAILAFLAAGGEKADLMTIVGRIPDGPIGQAFPEQKSPEIPKGTPTAETIEMIKKAFPRNYLNEILGRNDGSGKEVTEKAA
jgi:hypothetical protein